MSVMVDDVAETLQKKFKNGTDVSPVDYAVHLVHQYNLLDIYKGAEALESTAKALKGTKVDGGYVPLKSSTGLFNPIDHPPSVLPSAFSRIGIDFWLNGIRPSLPTLAAALLERHGIDITSIDDVFKTNHLTEEENSLSKAIMAVALRAEYIKGERREETSWKKANDYHNAAHTAHAAVMSNYIAEIGDVVKEDEGAQKFSLEEKLIQILAGFAHDIDHPGEDNPQDDPVRNERIAFDAVKPILDKIGVSAQNSALLQGILIGTSINGPAEVVEKAALDFETHRNQITVFPELNILMRNETHLQMAATMNAADLFSSVASPETNKKMGALLSSEKQKKGHAVDFTTHKSILYFLENVVGEFGSKNMRLFFGDTVKALKEITESAEELEAFNRAQTGKEWTSVSSVMLPTDNLIN